MNLYRKLLITIMIVSTIGSSFVSSQSHTNINPLTEPSIDTPNYCCGLLPVPDTVIPDTHPTILGDVPSEWDWRDATYKGQTGNWMTPVRNQLDCGSCWAFGIVSAIEAMINIQKTNPNIDMDLSEQQLVSCVSEGDCRGGSVAHAFMYLRHNNGIIPESCFPYEAVDENGCNYNDCDNDPVLCEHKCEDWLEYAIPILNYRYYYLLPEPLIRQTLIKHGPLAATLITYPNFMSYSGGIYDKPVGKERGSHLVTLVGYNESENYWICKNSWGTQWGEDGYFRIACGVCKIGIDVYAVTIDTDSLNFPPTADAGGLYHGNTQQPINFDSSNSIDIDNNIISHHWSFGDGNTSNEANPTHSYSSKGIYNVTLTITDEKGEQSISKTAAFIDVWSIGDSWTYNTTFNINHNKLHLTSKVSFEDLKTQVTDKSGDTYKLDFNGKGKASISFNYNNPNFKLYNNLDDVSIHGSTYITKAGFGVKEINYHIQGRAELLIITPIMHIPLHIRLPIDIAVSKTYGIPRTLLGTYPSVGNSWSIPSARSLTTTTISTPFISVNKSFTETTTEKHITLKCTEEETLTIHDIPYKTYKISPQPTQTLEYHYAPSVNNIVQFHILDPSSYSFHLSLKSSNLQ